MAKAKKAPKKSTGWKKNPHFKKGFKRGPTPAAILASTGNSYYLDAENFFKPKKFTPREMLNKAKEYFEDVDANPWHKIERGKKDKLIKIPVAMPYTMIGVCQFMGISRSYFDVFVRSIADTDPLRQEYLSVIDFIRDTIYQRKYNGAAVGFYKERFIALDLGLEKGDGSGSVAASLKIEVGDGKAKTVLEETMKQLKKIEDGK